MRQRWKWKVFGSAALLGLLVFVLGINDFLAISRPVDGDILVVEGWIWDSSALKEASVAFTHGHYKWLVTVGAPGDGTGMAAHGKNAAALAAGRLRELGVDENRIVVVVAPSVKWHQTYTSALSVRNWLASSATETTSVDVFTLGTHARKSLVLFARALGPKTKVGVIAGTEDTYDTSRWWLSARGVHVVVRKTLGYLYAVFWPLPTELEVGFGVDQTRVYVGVSGYSRSDDSLEFFATRDRCRFQVMRVV